MRHLHAEPFLARLLGALALFVIALAGPHAAHAQVNMETPVYFEGTKSYYTLVKVGAKKELGSPTRIWAEMNGIALGLTHKGARGRLAKVDSKELHAFLRKHFAAQQRSKAWIGLRYYCNYHVSMWNDGTRLTGTDFQIWSRHWAAGTYAQCTGDENLGAEGVRPRASISSENHD